MALLASVALFALLHAEPVVVDPNPAAFIPDAGTGPDVTDAVVEVDSNAFLARINVGFIAEWGAHPNSVFGAGVNTRIGSQRWSALVEAWTVLPTTLTVKAGGSLNAFSVGGTLGGCGQFPVWSGNIIGCVAGRGAAMLIQPRNTIASRSGWQPQAAAGLRFSAEWPRDTWLGFFFSAQLFVPIVRGHVTSDGVDWWQPWVFGGAKVGLLVRLQ